MQALYPYKMELPLLILLVNLIIFIQQ